VLTTNGPEQFALGLGRLFGLACMSTLVLLGVALIVATPAHAAKRTDSLFPTAVTSGGLGGQFVNPADVVVNQVMPSDAYDGWIYVSDSGNHRIQAFDATREFQFAIGRNVVQPGGTGNVPNNERQVVAVSATGGTFVLRAPSGQETEPISFDASAATLEAALEGTPGLEPGDVAVSGPSGGPWAVDFMGGQADRDVPEIAAPPSGNQLTGGAQSVSVETPIPGANSVEVCTVASECRAGIGGGKGGMFSKPQGVDLDQTAGRLFVRDAANRRVQELNADGEFERAWGVDVEAPDGGTTFEVCAISADCLAGNSSAAAGGFDAEIGAFAGGERATGLATVPAGLPNSGNVVAADPGNRRLLEFDPGAASDAAVFVRGLGWDVDPSGGGGGFEICTEATGCKQAAPGLEGFSPTANGRFKNYYPREVAVDSSGRAYVENLHQIEVLGAFFERVDRLQLPAATPAAVVSPGHLAPTTGSQSLRTIEVDPDSDGVGPDFDRLYQSESNSQTAVRRIVELDLSVEPPQAVPGGPHVVGTNLEINGIGYDQSLGGGSGTLFAAIQSPRNAIFAFDDDGAVPPPATIEEPTAIGTKEATFAGTVDPQGFPEVSARFEVSSDGGTTWTPVGSAQTLPTVEEPVAVAATATTLTPGTTYLARLVATMPYGAGAGASAPSGSFSTIALAPTATTLQPLGSGPTQVTLAGAVNPNGTATAYRFEYVDAAGFAVSGFDDAERAPIPDGDAGNGGSDIEVWETVSGLTPSTVYRYRLIASNVEGTDIGETRTVTTTSSEFPTPPGRAYEMVTPPFKTTRSTASSGGAVGNNPNVGQPSVDGDAFLWRIDFLPLTEEVGAPGWGDHNLITRSSRGWGSKTLNTGAFLRNLDPTFSRSAAGSSNSAFTTFAWSTYAGQAALLPSEGNLENRVYTRRDGTGAGGYTAWVVSPELQQAAWGFSPEGGSQDQVAFNDAGTALARSGDFRGLAEDLGTVADEDPSEQQLQGSAGGSTLYTQHADDPDDLPAGAKDLAGECTGSLVLEQQIVAVDATGGTVSLTIQGETTASIAATASAVDVRAAIEALPSVESGDVLVAGPDGGPWLLTFTGFLGGLDLTQATADGTALTGGSGAVSVSTQADGDALHAPTLLPARLGSGGANETISTVPCGEAAATSLAAGTGVRTGGSSTVTSVEVDTGGFAVGQLVSGPGIAGGSRVVSMAPGQITLDREVVCGEAAGAADQINVGSPVVIGFHTSCGEFTVGQEIDGPGIPPGTTIAAIDNGKKTITLSAAATATSFGSTVEAPAPRTTTLSADTRHLTSLRGARLPRAITALSDTGARVFFHSPDSSPAECQPGTGSQTNCPQQLFVRQYGVGGDAKVRWISRPRSHSLGGNRFDGPMMPSQQIGQLGNGATFEGASRDGGVVYFRTNASLTPDDPNGGMSSLTGSASKESWDLFRYELPSSLDADPDDGALTRVSGGPNGLADPSTNAASGAGASLRFLSDDGDRAYFVTTSPIGGADESPPLEGSTTPGGTVGNDAIRNLYLLDATSEPPSYRFVARIPFADNTGATPTRLNACASFEEKAGAGQLSFNPNEVADAVEGASFNCVRGSAGGRWVVFATPGQLTEDDDDQASDIYLYDAEEDRLVRVSAPPAGASPYACQILPLGEDRYCNGDLGPSNGKLYGGNGATVSYGWGDLRYGNLAVDGSGEVSVYFESRSQLVPEDTNGSHWDVYQWRDGELSLISPGNSADDSWFSGNSKDGQDVFFTTSARIDPREIDEQDFDIYDARIGGGFPYTPPPEPCDVLALGCESAARSAPVPPAAATYRSGGSGNVVGARKRRACGKGRLRRGKRCVRNRAVAHRRCRKVAPKAKRRCIRKQVRRLTRAQTRRAK
jgi:hypothetical protein